MISTICRDNLKAIAQAYGKATGQSVTAISKEFYGNSAFLPKFFSGTQSISIDKYDNMIGLFLRDWPEDAKWPILRVIVMRGPVKKGGISRDAPTAAPRNQLSVTNAAAAGKRRSGVRADPA